jgi:hypothetical protein
VAAKSNYIAFTGDLYGLAENECEPKISFPHHRKQHITVIQPVSNNMQVLNSEFLAL